MQIGGSWVESLGDKGINANRLYSSGAEMAIDYVRVWRDASMIPEPSAFGLLAGVGALALCAVRRRKKGFK